MKKNIFFCLITFLFNFNINAQSITLDKNKVVDFFQNQQYEEAVNYLLPIINTDSNNIETLGYLGYASYMNDNITTAEKYFQKVFSIDSNNISAIQYLSIIYSKQKTQEALALTYRLINLQPTKSSYYRQMGDLFRRLKEDDSALICYRHAYYLSQGDFKSVISLADLLIEKKSFLNADSILDIGLAKDSMNTRLLELRIKSAFEHKDYQCALIPGERLMKIDGGIYISGLTQLALSYYFLKRYTDCIRVCTFLENQNIYSESLFYYEAMAWAKLKDYDKSNELLKKCVQMAISAAAESYYYSMGENYEALGQFKKAIVQYDTAYLFKNPIMQYNCGRIAESELKNKALAKKYYTVYLSVAKPQSPEEKKAYEYVKTKWGKRQAKLNTAK
jgi:tetratricopeptide (TPR) repeat protein